MILIDQAAGSRDLHTHEPLCTTATLGDIPSKNGAPGGDVLMTGNGPDGTIVLGVELKSITDLLSSQVSGRLRTQLTRMQRYYYRTWLLTYGEIAQGPSGELLYTNSRGVRTPATFGAPSSNKLMPYAFLESLRLELTESGILLHHVSTVRHAAVWIDHTHHFYAKPWKAHTILQTVDTSQQTTLMPSLSMNPRENERLLIFQRMASCLPNVSYAKGLSIARHFSTLQAFITCTIGDLCDVDGIGPTIAGRIHKAINARKHKK